MFKYVGEGWGAETRMFLAFACLCDLKEEEEKKKSKHLEGSGKNLRMCGMQSKVLGGGLVFHTKNNAVDFPTHTSGL